MKFTSDLLNKIVPILLVIIITLLANYTLVPFLQAPWQWAKRSPLLIEYQFLDYDKQGIVKISNRNQSDEKYSDIDVHITFDKEVRLDSVSCWTSSTLAFSGVEYTSGRGEEFHLKLVEALNSRDLVYYRLHFHGLVDTETVSYPRIVVKGNGVHISHLEAAIFAAKIIVFLKWYLFINILLLVFLAGFALSYFKLKATIKLHEAA
ncbi:MAG TPA: hypothetical protein PKI17_06775 [Syntrophomonas sp.]|nr:hypothetical protein [Syntrophomonas sp.]